VGGHDGATEPLLLRVGGGGKFGRGKFTVLWAGLRGDVPALRDLSRAIQRSLKRAKLPFDDRRFKPHLTIARPGGAVPAEAIAADRALLGGYEGPPWTIDELVLVRSHLGPKPRYDHLATWPLLTSQG
jgi:2'-5' RNA ligase